MSSCTWRSRTMRQWLGGAGFKMENRVTILMEKEPLSQYPWAQLLPPRSHLKRRGQHQAARGSNPAVGFLLPLSSSASRAQSWFWWRCQLGIAARCQDDALPAGNEYKVFLNYCIQDNLSFSKINFPLTPPVSNKIFLCFASLKLLLERGDISIRGTLGHPEELPQLCSSLLWAICLAVVCKRKKRKLSTGLLSVYFLLWNLSIWSC